MRYILILLLLVGTAYGQSSPTSAKTRFVNGLYVGTKLDSYFAAADSNAIYWRADSVVMAKYKGTARRLLFASDSTIYFDKVVRTFGTQTVGGNKTFSNDIVVNELTIGRGGGNNSGNIAFGNLALTATTSGSVPNIAIGNSALKDLTTGATNVAIGNNIANAATTLVNSLTSVGQNTFTSLTSGDNNTALGSGAGRFNGSSNAVTSINSSTFIGSNTKASATTGVTNETVIGFNATGNGSNTVTVGNSSVTGTYLQGLVNLTAQPIGDSSKGIKQVMATNDYWQIYGADSAADKGEMVFKVGDNGKPFYNGGQRFRFTYDGGGISIEPSKDVLIIDYDTIKTKNLVIASNGTLAASTGSTSYIPKFTSSNTIGNSVIYDDGTNIGVGTTTPSSKFHVDGTMRTVNAAGVGGDVLLSAISGLSNGFRINVNTSNDIRYTFANGSNATVFDIQNSGEVTSLGVYTATVGGTNRDVFVDNTGLIGYVSSFRASKKNIAPLSNTDWLHNLNPVTFNYRIKDKKGNYTDSAYKEKEYGLIAEEVEAVNPEMVFYDADSTGKHLRGVHYSKLIIPLLKEIQDQKKRIDAQQTAIEALIKRIELLEKR